MSFEIRTSGVRSRAFAPGSFYTGSTHLRMDILKAVFLFGEAFWVGCFLIDNATANFIYSMHMWIFG